MKEPTKCNFTQPLNIKKIEDEFEFSKNDCYSDFSIPNEEDLQLHFKRKPNFCFPNFFFMLVLKVRLANMDIQSVFSKYKTAVYMC